MICHEQNWPMATEVGIAIHHVQSHRAVVNLHITRGPTAYLKNVVQDAWTQQWSVQCGGKVKLNQNIAQIKKNRRRVRSRALLLETVTARSKKGFDLKKQLFQPGSSSCENS
jgi:hypothetical protein